MWYNTIIEKTVGVSGGFLGSIRNEGEGGYGG